MCGIAGFISCSDRLGDPSRLIETMLDCIQHRGPDDWGSWSSSDHRITLGHRRLSILDTSDSGRQPFASPSGRYHLTFNGEIYNFKEIRDELGNVELSSTGDTAVVAAAFDRWGIMSAIQRFNGMFAIGVWDQDENRLTLARDRIGKKPVYYGNKNGVFAFASELKPFRLIDGFCDDICPSALEEVLKYGYVAAPRSIFRSVQKLTAGDALHVDLKNGEIKTSTETYWRPHQSLPSEIPDNADDYLEHIEEILTDAVKIRMISDVPLGAFLSGGIDSSLVCALMAKVSSEPIKTFSIGFHESGFDEAQYAKKIANHLETDHHELYFSGAKALELVDRLPTIYDEPFADSSQLPTYLVSQFARQHVTVALSGDGGDELFSGYSRFGKVLSGWNRKQGFAGKLTTQMLNLSNAIAPGMTANLASKAHGRKLGPLAQKKVFLRELERRNATEFTHYYQLNNSNYAFEQSLLDPEFRSDTPPDQDRDLSRFSSNLVKMSVHDMTYFLPEDILTKVDRASMAVSLEARNPLLDHRLVAPALRGLEKFPNDKPKWALQTILSKHVPRQYFDRAKQGFGIPYGQWMAGPLREWAEGLLNSSEASSFFDRPAVNSVWEEFIKGDHLSWKSVLWRILMFESWYRNFFKSPSN